MEHDNTDSYQSQGFTERREDHVPEQDERVQILTGSGPGVEYASIEETLVARDGEVWVRCHSEWQEKTFWVPLRRIRRYQ